MTIMIELTLDMAERAAKAALAKAKALGTVMTASIVDEAGRTVLVMRGDGAGFFSTETSRAKAAAAVLRGEVLPSIGGVPITKNGRFIGAIGCGGGTGDQDHDCAVAGAAAVGSS